MTDTPTDPYADSETVSDDFEGEASGAAAEPIVVRVKATAEALHETPSDRLDRWLVTRLALEDSAPPLSRSRLKALLLEGNVSSGGTALTNPSASVVEGEVYQVTLPPPEPAAPEAQDIPLSVVFEDDHLIVVDKPSGMTVHPAPGSLDGTLVNALLAHCGDSLSGIGGVKRPGIVHRIDKETSGLLVVAKTDEAHAGLAELFQNHDIERLYFSLVWNVPLPPLGRIETDIGRHPGDRQRMAVRPEGRGKHAVTHYKVRERFGDVAALVECQLETGRTHQIRVHMAHLGHPLIGDPLYARGRTGKLSGLDDAARAAVTSFPRPALHAAVLGFEHPVTGEALYFDAPLPPDFHDLLEILRKTGGPMKSGA